MRITKKRLLIAIIIVIILVIIFWLIFKFNPKAPTDATQANALSGINPTNLTTNGDATVDWTEAIKILRSGEVDTASQYHDLEVVLTMKNGDEITTTEPSLDEVFTQIELCGDTCKDIISATE